MKELFEIYQFIIANVDYSDFFTKEYKTKSKATVELAKYKKAGCKCSEISLNVYQFNIGGTK